MFYTSLGISIKYPDENTVGSDGWPHNDEKHHSDESSAESSTLLY